MMKNAKSSPMRCTNRITRFRNLLFYLGCIPAALLFFGCGPGPKPEPPPPLVPAIRIADAEEMTVRSFPGQARAGQEVNLSFRVSGPLIELPVHVGDKVKKGDFFEFKVRLTKDGKPFWTMSKEELAWERLLDEEKKARIAKGEWPPKTKSQ